MAACTSGLACYFILLGPSRTGELTVQVFLLFFGRGGGGGGGMLQYKDMRTLKGVKGGGAGILSPIIRSSIETPPVLSDGLYQACIVVLRVFC